MKCAIFEEHSSSCVVYFRFSATLFPVSMLDGATELSILLTFCLTAVKNHAIKYCTTVYERNGKKIIWSIKNSGEILN